MTDHTFNDAQTRRDLTEDQIMSVLRRTVQGELLGLLTIKGLIPSMAAECLAREFRAASQPSPAATVETCPDWCPIPDAAKTHQNSSAATEGEPFGWFFECHVVKDEWAEGFSLEKPKLDGSVRNLTPLYRAVPQEVQVLDFFSQSVDAWGALEWFDRLAKAVREQDKAVVAGDMMTMETCRNVASSSAMRLVRDYEPLVRAALSLTRPHGAT